MECNFCNQEKPEAGSCIATQKGKPPQQMCSDCLDKLFSQLPNTEYRKRLPQHPATCPTCEQTARELAELRQRLEAKAIQWREYSEWLDSDNAPNPDEIPGARDIYRNHAAELRALLPKETK